jgi:hypothetical protein
VTQKTPRAKPPSQSSRYTRLPSPSPS